MPLHDGVTLFAKAWLVGFVPLRILHVLLLRTLPLHAEKVIPNYKKQRTVPNKNYTSFCTPPQGFTDITSVRATLGVRSV
ncbi:MAG: hypothetical protein AAB460_02440 [Patescibacteria group bacterium]